MYGPWVPNDLGTPLTGIMTKLKTWNTTTQTIKLMNKNS